MHWVHDGWCDTPRQVASPHSATPAGPPRPPLSPARGPSPSLQLQLSPRRPRSPDPTPPVQAQHDSSPRAHEALQAQVASLQRALEAEEARSVQLLQRMGEATQQAAQARQEAEALKAKMEGGAQDGAAQEQGGGATIARSVE